MKVLKSPKRLESFLLRFPRQHYHLLFYSTLSDRNIQPLDYVYTYKYTCKHLVLPEHTFISSNQHILNLQIDICDTNRTSFVIDDIVRCLNKYKLNTSREREGICFTGKLCVRPIMTMKREIFVQQEGTEFSSMLFTVIRI